MTLQAASETVQEPIERTRAKPRRSRHALAGRLVPRKPSRAWLRFFDLYLSVYVPFHFSALRLALPERFPLTARPLIVCINHPSWWDPLTSILLSRFLLRRADHYAPIDALSLSRYGILGKLGLFPVEQGTPRGAVQFLRSAQSILAEPDALLWLTPQGGFTDVRARPVLFKSGLASLIKRLDHVTVLPLAYEYAFWNERKPEILALCGRPLTFTCGQPISRLTSDLADDPGTLVAEALSSTQDELAARVATRDPRNFMTVMAGNPAVSGLRAICRNIAAAVRADSYGNEPVAGRDSQEP